MSTYTQYYNRCMYLVAGSALIANFPTLLSWSITLCCTFISRRERERERERGSLVLERNNNIFTLLNLSLRWPGCIADVYWNAS